MKELVQKGLKYLVNICYLQLVKSLVYGLIYMYNYLVKDRTGLHISKGPFYRERMILQNSWFKEIS